MYWYNGVLDPGETLQISIHNPGLLYGATVFTTLRVYDGTLDHSLTFWQAHCDRLRHSIQTLGWTSPDWKQIHQGAIALAQQYPVLRITLFPEGQEWITGRSLPPDLSEQQQHGITAWVATPPEDYGRSLPHLKTGNYLASWQAKRDAQAYHAQEAILINAAGHWLETSTGTLWGWGKGTWWTPPLADGILPGIGRSHLMSRLRCQNERIRETSWTGDVISQLEAIAYSNAVVGVVPIHTVLINAERQRFNPKHPSIQTLVTQFHSTSSPDF